MLSCAAVPAKTCLVTVVDIRGVRHTAEVMSETLFEAAVLGLRARLDAMSLRAVPIVRVFSSKTEKAVAYLLGNSSNGWK
jgi:hypothetical protein